MPRIINSIKLNLQVICVYICHSHEQLLITERQHLQYGSLAFTGSNAEQTRRHNRCVVLGQIRRAGKMGRAEMARVSGLSVQAVSNIIASLQQEGMLLEAGQRSRGRGLPSPQYALNPDGGFALGFEVRPHSTSVALLNLMGELRRSASQPLTDNAPAAVSRQLRQLMNRMLSDSAIDSRLLLGAGVVMPGPFIPTGLANTSSVLPHWQDVEAQSLFAKALSIPVLVENDANAAAVGEYVSGRTASLDNYAFIYFGSGVGLGIVHKGRLFRGGNGNAGELGQILVPAPHRTTASDTLPETRACRHTTDMSPLEDIASRTALLQTLATAGLTIRDDAELVALSTIGNPHLESWLNNASAALSHAVHVVENLFDPDTVVLGGALPDPILAALVERISLAEHSTAQRKDRLMPRVMQGRSGDMSAAQGGAALVINSLFTPRTLS